MTGGTGISRAAWGGSKPGGGPQYMSSCERVAASVAAAAAAAGGKAAFVSPGFIISSVAFPSIFAPIPAPGVQ